MRLRHLPVILLLLFASIQTARAVIFLETDDPQHNTTTPGDNSGWQYEGQFKELLGTPIAPHFFIAAQHIGGNIGNTFTFHGATYTTTAAFSDPGSDLRIWQVSETFPDYAPLYQSGAEVGKELHVYGRGTQRGVSLTPGTGGRIHGWRWGPSDYVERWGRNVVAATVADSNGVPYLQATFDSPGLPDEVHLSGGNSSGGVFILEDGLWKLAAVNYAVDDIATQPNGSDEFSAAVFDTRGYYIQDNTGAWVPTPDDGVNVPTSFYSTRVWSRLGWIKSIIGSDTATQLAPETYQNWLALYFAPGGTVNTDADPDGDGVPNLLEYAFNLDPTYPEPVTMVAGSGLRGLPLIRPESVSSSDARLTVEYVRRTAAGNPGIAYAVQWTSSLAPGAISWTPGGTEVVTPINARWERVKVTDTVSLGGTSPVRFARVAVTPAPSL